MGYGPQDWDLLDGIHRPGASPPSVATQGVREVLGVP